MKVIVKVRGVSPDESWKYQDFTYSCIEYDYSWQYTCCGEGEWSRGTTPSDISTHFLFICAGITQDTKQQFLGLLEKRINEKFHDKIPTITEFRATGSEIRQYLVPSLKNLCFMHFSYGPKSRETKLSKAPLDIQNDFADFKLNCRPNECW